MKKNNIKRESDVKTGTLFDVICFCCFTLLIICMLTHFSEANIRNDRPATKDKFTSFTETEMQITNNLLKHQLQQARTSNYQIKKTSKSKDELEQMIQQLHSVVSRLPEQQSKGIITDESALQTEPREISKKKDADTKPTGKTRTHTETQKLTKSDHQHEPVSEDTLKILETLMNEPNGIQNPFELAEILYHSGYTDKAAKLYQQALNLNDPNTPEAAREKAWILFQIGNCLRNNDPKTAKKIYRNLIAEYPDYLWADFAKVQEKIINWHLKDKPQELIKECRKLAEE